MNILSKERQNDIEAILASHAQVIDAHLKNDVPAWLNLETDHYISVNRGEISYPTKADREAQRSPYLAQTTFTKYIDLVPPVVEVADDGSLGWLIAQVELAGIRTFPDGQEVAFQGVYAWIELYKNMEGQWLCVGNVSNAKPD